MNIIKKFIVLFAGDNHRDQDDGIELKYLTYILKIKTKIKFKLTPLKSLPMPCGILTPGLGPDG